MGPTANPAADAPAAEPTEPLLGPAPTVLEEPMTIAQAMKAINEGDP